MPMPLREVLRDPTVVAAEPLVLAGRTRLGRLVTWVHTSEVLDIATLLRGGDDGGIPEHLPQRHRHDVSSIRNGG